MYLTLKHLHMICALISILGFVLRSAWAFQGSPLLTTKTARILPHINDSILLLLGVAMMVWSQQYPWQQHWLAVKLALLICYILLGAVTLKTSRNSIRLPAFSAATFCFVAMVFLARTRPF